MKAFDWPKKRVLVTGGAGFLGSHLMEELASRNCREIAAPSRAEVDLRDPVQVGKLFADGSYDLVIHLAASVGGIGANEASPADFFYDNALMGLHVIHEASSARVGRLVLLGTICAYPKFAPIPFREEDLWNGYPEETNAPYGIAKRSLLVAADAYRRQYGLDFVGVFPTNLYGPRDDFDLKNSHVIPALIRKCEEARRQGADHVRLWGTGKVSRDFLYVTDAVTGILQACEAEAAIGEAVNLGSGREITISDLAGLVAQATGFAGRFEWDASRPDGQPRRCVSAEKARKLLGFAARVPLEEGLKKTVQGYRGQKQVEP